MAARKKRRGRQYGWEELVPYFVMLPVVIVACLLGASQDKTERIMWLSVAIAGLLVALWSLWRTMRRKGGCHRRT